MPLCWFVMDTKDKDRDRDRDKDRESKEEKSRKALHDLGLEIADKLITGLEKKPTHQLVLQKLLEPIVRHILNYIFPWVVGVAILFLVLLICTVITCVIVLRTPSSVTAYALSI